MTVSAGHIPAKFFLLGSWCVTTICREYTSTRGARGSKAIGTTNDKTVIGQALDVLVTVQYGRYCTEIEINSLQIDNTVSWVVISHGLHRYVATTL